MIDLLPQLARRRRRVSLDPRRAIAYVRSSKDEAKLGPGAQRSAIEAWCRTSGIHVTRVFHDQGVSGAAELDRRPALLSALDALRSDGCGVLVVCRRDRLARDDLAAALVQRLVERAGGVVRAADGVGNGSSPEDQLLRSIVDSFAAYERALLRVRTKSALAVRRAAGLRTGTPGWGWRVGGDGRHLIPDERERAVLKSIRRLRRGRSLRELVVELARRGVRNRKGRCSWSVGQVQRLLAISAGQ